MMNLVISLALQANATNLKKKKEAVGKCSSSI